MSNTFKDVQIKKNERPQLLSEIKQEHNLKSTTTCDKSAPIIDSMVAYIQTRVKTDYFSDRPQLLKEIESKGSE